ncbi:TIGR00282 family metallophosphoesterase [Helicobacter pametensis]|uniref:TIGR00282 family metallophosphoesterase n=1 Tax=Helicobacter pametensis TaxID=95149 RepID=UPI0004BAC83A|nr:TIGR00282 family metallophosphoesterase [Helicobacter pametensis]
MLKIGIIGDIVGRNARQLILRILPQVRKEHKLDFVVANAENASHGFGLSIAHAKDLLCGGIDVLTGGNHSFDKKEICSLLADSHLQEQNPILRPHNCSKELEGSGLYISEVRGERLAILNLMGHFGMPHCDNVFVCARDEVQRLHERGVSNIVIDIHAEATSEKRTLFEMLKGDVSAICGTHTHIGTDDLMIENGSAYVSDVGMCGALDSVIGMESDAPIKRGLSGMGHIRFEVSKSERTIFQMIIISLEQGRAIEAYKIRYVQTLGWLPTLEAICIPS